MLSAITSSERIFSHFLVVSKLATSEDEPIVVKLNGAMEPPLVLKTETFRYINILVAIVRNDLCRIVFLTSSSKHEVANRRVCIEDSTGVTSSTLKSPSVELPFAFAEFVAGSLVTCNCHPVTTARSDKKRVKGMV